MKFNKDRIAKLAGIPSVKRSLNESRKRSALRKRLLSESSEADELNAMLRDLGIEEVPASSKKRSSRSALDAQYGSMDSELAVADFMGGEYMGDEDFDSSVEYDPYQSETMSSYDDESGLMSDMPSLTGVMHSDPYMDDYEEESSFDDTDFLGEAEDKDEDKPEKVGKMPPVSRPPTRTPSSSKTKTAKEKDKKDEMVEISEKDLIREVRNIKRRKINEARLRAVIEDELREVLSEMRHRSKFK